MPKRTTSNWPVKSVETVFGIIELLDEAEEVGVTEVAAELDVAKSTAHDHLRTLERLEYVVREDGRYRLGMRFLRHGMTAKGYLPIAEEAKGMLEHVAKVTDETVWLVIEEHGQAVYIDVEMGERAVPMTGRIGRQVPLHVIASGKAILANLPEERRRTLVDRDLEERTPNTITDPAELREELATIRETNVAFNRSESYEGIRAVACPVFKDQEIRGAITCSGPAERMKGDRFHKEIPDIVSGAANELMLRLSSS